MWYGLVDMIADRDFKRLGFVVAAVLLGTACVGWWVRAH
jgi:hypothetical protein